MGFLLGEYWVYLPFCPLYTDFCDGAEPGMAHPSAPSMLNPYKLQDN